ncbi:MAG: hypothetical protein ACE5R4_15405 [Armatimonadota bacterium]
MRRALPVIVTVLVLAGALYLSRRTGGEPPQPEQAVWDLTDATSKADVKGYLDCLTGDLRARVEQTVREQGEAGFAEYLRRSNEELTGTVTDDLAKEELAPDRVRLKVEFIYRDGQQTQWMTVQREGRRWRIAEITGESRRESLIPYGTPVGPLDLDLGKKDEERKKTGVAPR